MNNIIDSNLMNIDNDDENELPPLKHDKLEMLKKYGDPLLLLINDESINQPIKCNMNPNQFNLNQTTNLIGGGKFFKQNMGEINEKIKDIFITKKCFIGKIIEGTRTTPVTNYYLDIELFKNFLYNDKKKDLEMLEICSNYEEIFDLIRKMYGKWSLCDTNVNNYLNCFQGFNVKLIPYLIKLANTELDDPTTIKEIIKDRVENSQKTPGLIYTYLKRGNFKLIPLIDRNAYNKTGIHEYKFNKIFDEALNSNSPIYLIKMVSIKSTNLSTPSQFGDHQFMILTFSDDKGKNYWIGTGGGYTDGDKKDYLVYSIDHAGWDNFNIKSPKNHYVYPNGALMITKQDEKNALKKGFMKFYNDSGEQQAKFIKDNTFGTGITPMKNGVTVPYQRYITSCTTMGENCATYVNTIFNSVENIIKGNNETNRIIQPTQHLNFTARLASLFYHMPNTGKTNSSEQIESVFETRMTALKGQTLQAKKYEDKYYNYLKKLKDKALQCGIKSFGNDLIEYIKEQINKSNDITETKKKRKREPDQDNKTPSASNEITRRFKKVRRPSVGGTRKKRGKKKKRTKKKRGKKKKRTKKKRGKKEKQTRRKK